MGYNYTNLQVRIKTVCGTNKVFARLMNLSERSLSLKMNNKVQFTQSEIEKATEILAIDKNEIANYFFC